MLSITLLSLLLAVPLSAEKITSAQVARVIAVAFIFSGVLVLAGIDYQSLGSGVTTFGGLLKINSLSCFLEAFIYIMGAAILLISSQKGISSPANINEFSILILVTTMGSSVLVSTQDVLTLYLAIELQSLPLYVMCSMSRNSQPGTSAGLKYFVIGAIASAMILLGSSLLYSISGHTNLVKIFEIATSAVQDSSSVLSIYNINESLALALVILTVGLITKIGAAPFHFRSPDVYNGSPTIVTTRLTIVPKLALFGVILNIYPIGITLFVDNEYVWQSVLLIVGLLSLVVGTVLGLAQTQIKRLLAFSTISHLGFMFLGLGTGTIEGWEAMLFYLVQYSITSLGVFSIVIAFGTVVNTDSQSVESVGSDTLDGSETRNTDLRLISDLSGIGLQYPILAMAFTVALFSMAGVPPLVGFFAKYNILIASINSGQYFVSTVAILGSVLSAYYYIHIIRTMYFNKPNKSFIVVEDATSSVQSFVIAVVTLIQVLYIINPQIFLNITELVAFGLFGS